MTGTGRACAIRRLGPLLILACACACLAPGRAQAQGSASDSLRLTWTAPGDDGLVGTVSRYEARGSTSPIVTEVDYALATLLPGAPTPSPARSHQSMRVRGLAPGTVYWFCVRSVDEAGNWSGLSNVLRWDGLLDTSAPQAPENVAAVPQEEGKAVRVTWRPNTEGDLAGYAVFRAEDPDGPWAQTGRVAGDVNEWVDQRLPEAPVLSYQVAAFDEQGNLSARSRAVVVNVLEGAPTAWKLRAAYPNPVRIGGRERIPVAAPAAAVTTLEVVDGGGQRVRRLASVLSAPGLTEFEWDGRNEAGQLCAPGVYRAWLLADGVRQSIRLARLP